MRTNSRPTQSNLIWNELMVGHVPEIYARNLPDDLGVEPVLPANKVFPLDQVENRQKALFAAIRHIWATV